jgi:phosphatidylinositol alpha-1,6-mannosyltransferase
MKPKLALLTFDFAPQIGGVQTYLLEVCKRLSTAYEIVVITPAAGLLAEDLLLRRLIIPSPNITTLVKHLRQEQADIVLIGHAHPRMLLAAALAAKNRYAALAYGNDFLAAQSHWHKPLFNWLLGRAKPLITISQANVRRLRQLGIPEAVVVYPGTDPIRFTPATPTKRESLTLLTMGRLVPRKGVDITLRALAQLVSQFPDLRYHIGGVGPDKGRLEHLTTKLGLNHLVTFLGHVPDDKLPGVYRQADIFVMPAREIEATGSVEGFGIVYLEASASGLPVIAGRSGGAVEAVRDGETGFLVAPDDLPALTETLARLLADADLRQRLGQNGRRWIESEMNWDRAAHHMRLALSVV